MVPEHPVNSQFSCFKEKMSLKDGTELHWKWDSPKGTRKQKHQWIFWGDGWVPLALWFLTLDLTDLQPDPLGIGENVCCFHSPSPKVSQQHLSLTLSEWDRVANNFWWIRQGWKWPLVWEPNSCRCANVLTKELSAGLPLLPLHSSWGFSLYLSASCVSLEP